MRSMRKKTVERIDFGRVERKKSYTRHATPFTHERGKEQRSRALETCLIIRSTVISLIFEISVLERLANSFPAAC